MSQITRMFQRRGTEQQWADANPVLGPGEVSVVFKQGGAVDFKVGNGQTVWNNLPYLLSQGEQGSIVVVNAYTQHRVLTLANAGRVVEMNSPNPLNVTIPPISDVNWAIGTIIEIHQYGAGQVTIVPGENVAINSPETLKLAKQFASAVLRYRGSNVWLLEGNLEAA